MFKNLNTDPKKKPRLLGELGDLSHTKVSSSVFTYKKSTEIFGQDAAADYIHQVIEGAVRTHKMLSDGRRQIGAFHLPGDIFGLENGSAYFVQRHALLRDSKTSCGAGKCRSVGFSVR